MRCSNCSSPIAPVVALDIDGTLGNYHHHFLSFACAYLGYTDESLAVSYRGANTLAEHLDVDLATYRRVKLAYRQGGLKRSMPSYPGASQLTHSLRSLGIEIWITTTRPYLLLDNIDPDTREWLRRNQIAYDYLIYGEDKYTELVNRVDTERILCVVDDLPEMLEQADALDVPTIQRWTPYNRAIRRDVGASTMANVADMVAAHYDKWKA